MTADNARLVNQALQQVLELARGQQFKILHEMLVNGETRSSALDYIEAVMGRNIKRAQLQTDERLVSGDGFTLNFLSVLQQLSVKIKLDKVDPLYPNHPVSRCCVKVEDTRIKSSSQEVTQWLDVLQKEGFEWQDPKFPTECYFLTLHAHHLSVAPVARKYQRRLRELRDLQRMVDEMELNESHWAALPAAHRNRLLLKRWKSQVKRLQKGKLCAAGSTR